MATFRSILWVLTPIVLVIWLNIEIAREWGIIACFVSWAVCGALLSFGWSLKSGKDFFQAYRMGRAGILGGILACVPMGIILSCMGYEGDTGPGKLFQSRLSDVKAAMRAAAKSPDLPYEKLRPEVVRALAKLPDHPMDRPISTEALLKQLDDPEIRPQVVLALGRFESQATKILPVLTARLKSEEPRVRAAATMALTGMRPWTPALRDQVFSMLSDKDEKVRRTAIFAVAKIAPFLDADNGVEKLREVSETLEPDTRETVERLLTRLPLKR